MSDQETEPPLVKPTVTATQQNTLTAAIVAIGALLPGKVAPVAIGMIAPFISEGIIWFVRERATEWLAERKATAPARRTERYLRQMQKELRKMKPNDPDMPLLQTRIREVTDRLHAHKISQLEMQAPTPPQA